MSIAFTSPLQRVTINAPTSNSSSLNVVAGNGITLGASNGSLIIGSQGSLSVNSISTYNGVRETGNISLIGGAGISIVDSPPGTFTISLTGGKEAASRGLGSELPGNERSTAADVTPGETNGLSTQTCSISRDHRAASAAVAPSPLPDIVRRTPSTSISCSIPSNAVSGCIPPSSTKCEVTPGRDRDNVRGECTHERPPPSAVNVNREQPIFGGIANATPKIVDNGDILTLDFGVSNLALGSNLTGVTSATLNTFFGANVGNALTTGTGNVAVGHSAFITNTIGVFNTAVGYGAGGSGAASSSFNYMTAVGYSALNESQASGDAFGAFTLWQNMTGTNNAAFGYSALSENISGNDNSALGNSALLNNVSGCGNTAVGTQCMFYNQTGNNNTAVGLEAAGYGSSVSANFSNTTAVGAQALYNNSTGSNITCIGHQSLYSNTAGVSNVAVGYQALYSNTTGDSNVSVGTNSLYYNQNGNANTVVGHQAAGWGCGAVRNVNNVTAVGHQSLFATMVAGDAFGFEALWSNTTGTANVGVGTQSLCRNTSGGHNTVVGYQACGAGYTGTTTFNNASAFGYQALNITQVTADAFGSLALNSNTIGTHNAAFGSSALAANTTGSNNVAVGYQAGYNTVTGDSNVAVGVQSLYVNETGGNNTCVGFQAAKNVVGGSNNTVIGTRAASMYDGNESDNIVIGYKVDGVTGESNVLRVGCGTGTGDGQIKCANISGIRGVSTLSDNAVAVLIDGNGYLGTVSSSARFKNSIEDMDDYTNAIMQLRPRKFKYNERERWGLVNGLVAEEVQSVLPALVSVDADAQPDTVKYHDLSVYLLQVVQTLGRELSETRNELRDLRELLHRT